MNNSSCVILFAGQGTPVIGMGKEIADITPETTEVWDCASDISGFDVRKMAFKGPMPKLTQTNYQQMVITAINLSMYRLLKQKKELNDEVFLGHSVGEYAALYAAGVLDLENALKAVSIRSQIMQEVADTKKGSMYVVKKVDYETLMKQIKELGYEQEVEIACDNVTHQVIGGEISTLKSCCHALMKCGYEASKLGVNGAWHTKLMSEGVQKIQTAFAEIPFHTPKKTLIMNASGCPETDIKQIKEHLATHLTHTVQWHHSLNYCWSHDYKHYIEIGHKKCLSNTCEGCFGTDSNWRFQHFYDLGLIRNT